MDDAHALAAYLFLPERQVLLFTQTEVEQEPIIKIDATKLETILCGELYEVPADTPEPQGSLRRKLGAFVKRTLDTDMLKSLLARVYKGKDGLRLVDLKHLHMIFTECALSHVAVVSGDIAILKWVVHASSSESIKVFKGGPFAIVDVFLCKALISLMFYPEIDLLVEKEMEEFMLLLKGQSPRVLNSYGEEIASLMSSLPEGSPKKKLTAFISHCDIDLPPMLDPVPAYSLHATETLLTTKLNEPKKVEKRVLLGASLPYLQMGMKPGTYSSTQLVCYSGSLDTDGQLKDGGLRLLPDCHSVTFTVPSDMEKTGCDIFVGSHIPISKVILKLLGRYARGDALSERDRQDLLNAQGVYDITMIIAPIITMENHEIFF